MSECFQMTSELLATMRRAYNTITQRFTSERRILHFDFQIRIATMWRKDEKYFRPQKNTSTSGKPVSF